MDQARRSLDRYRDAVELRSRYETAFCRVGPSRFELSTLRQDERMAREDLETAFALALGALRADGGS